MERHTENWLKIARYDLKAAQICFKSELYLKTIENCHSSIEKILKGLMSSQGEKTPPKIHNLMLLATEAFANDVKQDLSQTLDELNDIYILTRYPEDFDVMTAKLTKEKVEKLLTKTGDIFKWIEKKIK